MKQVYFIGLLMVNILLLLSCDKELSNAESSNMEDLQSLSSDNTESSNMEEIEGSWFRSFANKI